jgi:hypothetical protein
VFFCLYYYSIWRPSHHCPYLLLNYSFIRFFLQKNMSITSLFLNIQVPQNNTKLNDVINVINSVYNLIQCNPIAILHLHVPSFSLQNCNRNRKGEITRPYTEIVFCHESHLLFKTFCELKNLFETIDLCVDILEIS